MTDSKPTKKAQKPIKSITIDLPTQKSNEEILRSIDKNLIISLYKAKLATNTSLAISIWLFKMDYMFFKLQESLYVIPEKEKISLALLFVNDEVLEWYLRIKIEQWNEFKKQLIEKYSAKNPFDETFSTNEWVRIFDDKAMLYGNKSSSETGLVHAVLDGGLKTHPEQQYLDLIRHILSNGTKKNDRTGTGTISLTGASLRFPLHNNTLPLLTTKKVNFKAVLEELIFFVKGQTDNSILQQKGINIWTKNSTKEFYAKNNIPHEENDLGPVYGFQWRHFGAKYTNCNQDYTNEGIDQLQGVVDAIKRDPDSRRHVVVAWNPTDIPIMALPPCHTLFQFIVNDNRLDCVMYQRSGDIGLGIPFNIASYSLLTVMVAHVCGLEPGEFVIFIGDAHVYANHVDALKVQIEREPKEFPKIHIKRKIKNIDDFTYEDFVLEGYNPHGFIKMEMAV